ncbi:MAG: hypothetical protein RIQ71_1031 [Verrucomicrobiota bacterium]|jgi:hypothetical protein
MSERRQVIFFVDLLGARSRWSKGGRAAAELAFQDFRNLIAHSIKGRQSDELIHGLIETDAAALTFANVQSALDVGKKMFSAAFEQTKNEKSRRPWLRGCIVARDGDSPLRTASNFSGPISQVELMLYNPALLNAISVEKSGFKGMRLLVSKTLISPVLTKENKLSIGSLSFITLKKLRNSTYPKRIEGGFIDYLWMATEDAERLTAMERIMARRLRASAHDAEEFAQAAATQVLFHECAAIIGSLLTRQYFQSLKTGRRAAKSQQLAANKI